MSPLNNNWFTAIFSTLKSLQEDHTADTLHFIDEHIKEDDKIVLLSGDDYLYNCTHYFAPQAELYYHGHFSSKLFEKEKPDDEFWFFDNRECMDLDMMQHDGFTVEDFGEYYFRYMKIKIYKIS